MSERAAMRRFLDIALGSLAETDSMLRTLPNLYQFDAKQTARIERLRISITAETFKMLERGR